MSDEHYGKILHSFWTDPRIKRRLPHEARYLLGYYFSSPHKNLSGVYSCPLRYVSEETGLEIDEIRHLLSLVTDYVTFDEQTDEVFVHGLAETAIGEELKPKDTKRTAITRHLKAIHSPTLVRMFLERYGNWGINVSIPRDIKLGSDTPSHTPLDTPSHGVHGGTQTPSDTRAVAVKEQEPIRTEQENSDTTYPGAARLEEPAPAPTAPAKPPTMSDEDGMAHGEFMAAMRKVCSGKRDPITEADATQIGSIAKQMFERGWSRKDVYKATVGFRSMIERGEVKHIPAGSKFTLAKLYDKDPTVDQMQVGLDAYHATAKPPPTEKRKASQPEQIDPMDFLKRFGKTPEQEVA